MSRWTDTSSAALLATLLASAQAQELPPEIPDAPPATAGDVPGSAAPADAASPLTLVGRLEVEQLDDDLRSAPRIDTQRLVGDFRLEGRPGGSATLRLSDRFEWLARPVEGEPRALNILREFYVSQPLPWAPAGSLCGVDAGRVNWKMGNALWYTPLDYFKRDASISSAAMTPASIRENRLGTLMLRAQCDSGAGAVQAALVPRIKKDPSFDTSGLALGFDRTNAADAAALRVSRSVAEGTTVEGSALYRQGEGTTVGLGLSQLVGDSIVLGLDVANAPALADAQGRPFGRRATRAALSVAWTIPSGPTLTLEAFHAQDAYGASGWNALRGTGQGAPSAEFIGYLARRGGLQELPVRTTWFAMANWLRAFDNPNFELLAATSWNPIDGSHYLEAGATWHAGANVTAQLLVERNQGGPNTQYGLPPIKTAATLSLMWHF